LNLRNEYKFLKKTHYAKKHNAFLHNRKIRITFAAKNELMNPFSYSTIVKADYFYDRKKETARIVETLSGGNNMVLFAPRRFGKTSLVFRAIEQLEQMGFVCVYFDFIPVFSPESFVRLYTKALAAKQSNLNKFARIFISHIKNMRPVFSFGTDGTPEISIDFGNSKVDESTILQLLDMPEQLAGKNKRIIVFFDEFQEVEKLREIRFESLLRSKIQHQQNTNYLFLVSKTHLLQAMFDDKNKPFYHSASQMTIGPLPTRESIQYLQTKFASSNISIDDETAGYLISVAADIPYYIQMMASEVWQDTVNHESVISKQTIDNSVKKALAHKSDYYSELFEHQSKSRKMLLKALTVEGGNIFSIDYIRKHRLPAPATLQRAVRELVHAGIIEKKGADYSFADPFFRMYITEF
jgi:AAA+ ATPase superfamily predicted ATPase